MNPQVLGRCLLETMSALAVYKSVQFGMKTLPIQIEPTEPTKLSEWDRGRISRIDTETKNTVRTDGILAASGVSLLYILSPYIRSALTFTQRGKHTSNENIFLICKNTYSFAHGLLPQGSIFRRVILVGSLVLALPAIFPAKTQPPDVTNGVNSFINTNMYELVNQIRNFVTFPLLEIFLFHKILFLRVLPIISPVAAHALTAVAYTIASTSHHENSFQPMQMMEQFHYSLVMQMSFYLSGGRVLYPFIFSTVQNTKDLVFQSFTSFSIFEHAHVYRTMIDNAVSENLKVYGVADRGTEGLDIFVEPPPQDLKQLEATANLTKSLASRNMVVAEVATRALTHFSPPSSSSSFFSSSSSTSPHLSILDSVDFIFAFRTAVGMTRTHRDKSPLVRLTVQNNNNCENLGSNREIISSDRDHVVSQSLTPTPSRDSLFDPLPPHLIPIFCTDMAHVLVMQKYPHGMCLEDIKEFISSEIITVSGMSMSRVEDGAAAAASRSLTDVEMLEAEARMYEVWGSSPYPHFSSSPSNDESSTDHEGGANNPANAAARDDGDDDDQDEYTHSSVLQDLLEEVYRSIFLAQLQTCSVLAARYFQRPPLQALSAQDLRLLEGEREGDMRREGGENTGVRVGDGGRDGGRARYVTASASSPSLSSSSPSSSCDLLAALCPEEVETSFGPSHTHGHTNASADSWEELALTEGAGAGGEQQEEWQPWQRLALEVQQAEANAKEAMDMDMEMANGDGDREGISERERERERGTEKLYNPLNCILSTVSRREAVTVLYPYGLTIRRFQLLLNRAERRGDRGITEAKHRLRSELHSEAYKETLRKELLKNIEKGI